MLKDLRDYLGYSFDIKDENLRGQLDAIADFQAKDGSFSVLDDPHMPSDAFVDFHIYPTVMCSAILMKAVLLYPKECSCYLPVLAKALGRLSETGIGGDGYDYLDSQMEYLSIYIDMSITTGYLEAIYQME